ncbi:general secretion pathway protein GspB [Thermomonas flagellata]|uniref:general secretion pathway protein GspB n=1 Tax=Thermomonas flagellata TaxID=2888524 RepID=UPI001F034654|nr:general secretion pathway protein GspB [Thermomonas flagellata]
MSLILEALRKSEAERRRGQAPDLAQELPPAPAQPPLLARRGAWLAAALLLAIVAGLALWRWRMPPAAPAMPTDAPAAAAATPALAAAPRMVAPALAPPPAPTPAQARAVPSPAAPPPPPVATPTPPPAPASSPPAPAGNAATAAADLPEADAAGLPPMRLSMHVWDADPARRFVILDGQRMAEGDRRNGVQVIEIRRDGVIVEREGVRARLPLP